MKVHKAFPKHKKIRGSNIKQANWKLVRKRVIERDSGCCQMCGKVAVDLHHILFKSLGGADIDENLIALCREHHDLAHRYGKAMYTKLIELQRRHYPTLTKKDLKK